MLRDVTLGRLWNQTEGQPLTDMTAVIGKNGVGKSALFDAFGFLADALKSGVEEACDARGRGGFERIRSQGETGPIEFDVYYKEDDKAQPITYDVAIDGDEFGRPYLLSELLRQGQKGVNYERPLVFLILRDGKGWAWKGEEEGFAIGESEEQLDIETLNRLVTVEESSETEIVELEDRRRLGIATLGALKQHPRIAAFRRFIEPPGQRRSSCQEPGRGGVAAGRPLVQRLYLTVRQGPSALSFLMEIPNGSTSLQLSMERVRRLRCQAAAHAKTLGFKLNAHEFPFIR